MENSLAKRISNKFISLIGIWMPLILLYLVFISNPGGTKITLAYLSLFAIIGIVSLIFRTKVAYSIYISITSLLFSVLSFIDMGHFILYRLNIRPSTIYLLMEVNPNETSEYFGTYLSPKILTIIILILSSLVIGIVYSFSKFDKIIKFKSLQTKDKYTVLTIFLVSAFLLTTYRDYFMPYTAIKAVRDFKLERERIAKLDFKRSGDFQEVTHKSSNEKETYVVVVGESTTKTHLGLYGYYRQTNPLLTKRKDELFVFEDVRSPHTNTIASLSKSLIFDNPKTPEKKYNSTFVQLLNGADFKSYVISNQNPKGKYESTSSLIMKSGDEIIYTSLDGAHYDEVVMEPLKRVLSDKVDKKFIVIHLFGTHNSYWKRYPPEFDVFKDTPKTKFKHEKAYKTINEYDNAVRYNDYMVNSIIDEVQKTNTKSYVLYFSDHGEDVYETIDQSCHFERDGTEPMYQVPFMIWLSDKYKAEDSTLVWDTKRKYNHKHLIHTIADLSNVSFKGFEADKSVVNREYRHMNSSE